MTRWRLRGKNQSSRQRQCCCFRGPAAPDSLWTQWILYRGMPPNMAASDPVTSFGNHLCAGRWPGHYGRCCHHPGLKHLCKRGQPSESAYPHRPHGVAIFGNSLCTCPLWQKVSFCARFEPSWNLLPCPQ